MRSALVLVVLGVLCAACGSGGTRTVTLIVTETATATASSTAASEAPVAPYFLDGEQVAAGPPVDARNRAVATAAIAATLGEPPPGLHTSIPRGTRLLGVALSGGVATVDLSHEFASGGSSLSMRPRVAQIVYAATQFGTVRSVRFALDGKPVKAIGGEGIVVDPPVDRGDFEDETPAILVEHPGYGETVSSPVKVTGTANTFEATYQYELVAADGSILGKGFGTATSGTGTRGTFSFVLAYDVPGPTHATLVVYEDSAENGSRIHVRRIPLELEP